MGRLSRDQALMTMAAVTATRSTCSRLQVGVVFSHHGRIVMTGYNGAPAGMPHCDHSCNCGRELALDVPGAHTIDCRSLQPCTTAQHAERNAIAYAARNGVALEGTEVHVTHMPCYDCAGSLINAGVTKVTWIHAYRVLDGVHLLEQAGIQVVDYVIDDGVE